MGLLKDDGLRRILGRVDALSFRTLAADSSGEVECV